MRISKFAIAPALLVAACAPEAGAPEGPSVECAFGKDASYASDCVLESAGDGVFTIHHPDATFQRVRYDAASGALTSADGAEELASDPDPATGTLEFAIGTARYRIKRSDFLTEAP